MIKHRLLVLMTAALTAATLAACDSGGVGSDQGQDTVTSTDRGKAASDAGFAAIPEIVRRVEPSVVAILTGSGEGSGVVWRTDGLVLTNEHVVDNASDIRIAFADGRRSPAEVVATDPLTDLALLRTERRNLPAATFSDELPEVGELAVAIGNPLGFENTVTAGIISGLQRSIPGSAAQTQALVDLLQTDAAISPGNSGGALVGGDGRILGINVAYIPPQARAVSIGFAIPAPTVTDVATQLLEQGTVRHSFFGVQPAALTPQVADLLGVEPDSGVVVLEVVSGGPAAQAGIQPGDIIVSIGGEPVRSVEDFLAKFRRRNPGERIEVEFARDGTRRTVTVVLAERPAS